MARSASMRPKTSRCTTGTALRRASATAIDGVTHEIACDFIAGCDGYHGVCRAQRARKTRCRFRARVSVRLAGRARRRAAALEGTHLRQFRARLRARQHALTHARALLRAMFAGRSRGELERRALLGRIPAAHGRGNRRSRRPRRHRSRRASRRCAASWSSRCASAGCSWPATRRTSCRRPAPRD